MKKVDFGKLPTEQSNPRSRRIDEANIEQILDIINKEDRTVPGAVNRAKPQIKKAVALIVGKLKNGGRLFFAGAGTSGRLGVLEAAECPPTFNTPPSMVQAIMAGGKSAVFLSKEGAEDKFHDSYRTFSKKLTPRDAVVGIAASGVTPFAHGALSAAKKKGAAAIMLTCGDASRVKKITDCVIQLKVGPEVISGSTRLKAGTATKLALNMLTVTSMIRLGKVYQNWMVDLQPKSKKLEARALRLIQMLGKVSEPEAKKYLTASGKQVKTAILMARQKVDAKKARTRLLQTSGLLKPALHS